MMFFNKRRRAPAQQENQTVTTKTPEGDDKRFEAMAQSIMALAGAVEKQSERLNRLAIGGAMQADTKPGSKPNGAAPAFVMPKVDTAGLPKPDEDLEGFTKGFSERVVAAAHAAAANTVSKFQQDSSAQAQAEADRAKFLTGLAQEFDETYADLEPYSEVVEEVADKFKKKMERRNVNFEAYLRADPEGFMESVAEAARAEVKKRGLADKREVEKEEGGELPEGMVAPDHPILMGKARKPAATTDGEPDPLRGLVMGENNPGPAAPASGKEPKGSWVSDMTKAQKEHRIY